MQGQDELVVILSGEAVLVEDGGETVVTPGDVLAWRRARAMATISRTGRAAIAFSSPSAPAHGRTTGASTRTSTWCSMPTATRARMDRDMTASGCLASRRLCHLPGANASSSRAAILSPAG
jgi:hypothetical protein